MNRREVFLLVKKVLWLFLAALFLVGCGSGEEKKVQDLEFTVVPEDVYKRQDVYRAKYPCQDSLPKFALFVSLSLIHI